MTSRNFFVNSLVVTFLLTVLMVAGSFVDDEYGMFDRDGNEKITIYTNSRLSKYLMSYDYIPDNFDGILIGPSLSANIDTKEITSKRLYNASINGGNISEVKLLADNVMDNGRIKVLVVCLHPYLVKDHGRKTPYMDEDDYWGAFGSLDVIKHYLAKIFIKIKLKSNDFNEFGRNSYIHRRMEGKPSQGKIRKRAEEYRKGRKIRSDQAAVAELAAVLQKARRNGVQIFAYYYPYPEDILAAMREQHRAFKQKIDALLISRDVVWDMNNDEYRPFRLDYANYCDAIHLSEKGTHFIARSIDEKLGQYFSGHPSVEAGPGSL